MENDFKKLLQSNDPETVALGMNICKNENPSLWAILNTVTLRNSDVKVVSKQASNFDKLIFFDDVLFNELEKLNYINIGDAVKYKAMENSPNMIVRSIHFNETTVFNSKNSISSNMSAGSIATAAGEPRYDFALSAMGIYLSCRYYSKGNSLFNDIIDRMILFEKIKK